MAQTCFSYPLVHLLNPLPFWNNNTNSWVDDTPTTNPTPAGASSPTSYHNLSQEEKSQIGDVEVMSKKGKKSEIR